MTAPRTYRRLAVALTASLFVAGCSSANEPALPDVDVAQSAPGFASMPSVVGLMVETTVEQVVLRMPDGSERIFQVRTEDAAGLGLRHLASHAGLTDIGFRVHYDTQDGVEYVVGAYETAPPQ